MTWTPGLASLGNASNLGCGEDHALRRPRARPKGIAGRERQAMIVGLREDGSIVRIDHPDAADLVHEEATSRPDLNPIADLERGERKPVGVVGRDADIARGARP